MIDKQRESQRRYYEAHKAEIYAKYLKWRAANPEKARAAVRRWAARHPGYQKEWRRKNAEKANAAHRRYWRRNRERMLAENREWRRRNPDKSRATVRRRRARRLGAPICDFTAEQWVRMKAENHHRCYYCWDRKPLTQDHRIPLSKGGSHTASNIVPACASCNARKGTQCA